MPFAYFMLWIWFHYCWISCAFRIQPFIVQYDHVPANPPSGFSPYICTGMPSTKVYTYHAYVNFYFQTAANWNSYSLQEALYVCRPCHWCLLCQQVGLWCPVWQCVLQTPRPAWKRRRRRDKKGCPSPPPVEVRYSYTQLEEVITSLDGTQEQEETEEEHAAPEPSRSELLHVYT